ncbi:MAG: FimV/HubP family polar landmark protein, partial [Pseudomonadota bacterium]
MSRKSLQVLISALLSAPLSAYALGLGDIALDSSLNEPLRATIVIDSVQPGDLANFRAEIASSETFDRYGLDRPDFLNKLRFDVIAVNDRPVLRVRSTIPITEPFVTFLVEANWDSGRLLREYTVLLDPPVFNPEASAPPVRAPSTSTSQLSSSGGFVPRPEPVPAPAPAPRRPAAAPLTGPSYGPVRRNETLWAIADRARAGTDLSINQMMIAIYNANPEAFLGNINLLKEGSTLALPGASQAAQISRQDAFTQARAHNERWRSSSGRVAAAAVPRPAASTADTSSAADDRRLRLRAPDASLGEGADDLKAALDDERTRNSELSDEIDALRDELAENKRLFNVQNNELAELQSQLGEDEDGAVAVTDTEFVPVEDDTTDPVDTNDTVAADPAVAATDTGADSSSEPPADPPPDAAPEPTPAPVAAAPVPTPAPAAEPGLVGRLVSLWPAALGALALLGGLVFWRSRKEAETAEAESWEALSRDSAIPTTETPMPAEGQIEVTEGTASDADVEYFEDTGTFKPIDFAEAESDAGLESEADRADAPAPSVDFPFEDTLAGDESLKLDNSDPLAEADFHIAYGLYDQAADLVRTASEREPERRDLKLKLLEIFFVWGNKNAFVDAAQALRDEMGSTPDGDWNKVSIMGRQICPDVELFTAEDGASSADVVDLQLDETGETPLDLSTETVASDGGDMDFDLGEAVEAAGEAGAADNVIDFDFSGTTTAADDGTDTMREQIEAAIPETDDTEEIEIDDIGIDLDFSESTEIDEPLNAPDSIESGATGVVEALDIDIGEDFDELFGNLDDGSDDAGSTEVLDPASDAVASATESLPMDGFEDMVAAEDEERDKLLDTSELKVEMEELLASAAMVDDDEPEETPKPASEETGSFSAEIQSLADDGEDISFDLDDDDDDATELMEALSPDDTQQGEFATDFSSDVFGSDDDTVLAAALTDLPAEGDDTPAEDTLSDDEFGDIFADDADGGTAVMKVDEQDFSGDNDATVLAQSPFADDTAADDDLSFQDVVDADDATPAPEADEAFANEVFGLNGEDTVTDVGTDSTQETLSVDLDVGDPLFDSDGQGNDNTTVKVAAQDLALPDID